MTRAPENLAPPRHWTESAACRGHFCPDMWTPLGYGLDHRDEIREAKAICEDCPVRTECLDHAYAIGDKWGIYGGYTPAERNRMRRRRYVCTECGSRYVPLQPNQKYCDNVCRTRVTARQRALHEQRRAGAA